MYNISTMMKNQNDSIQKPPIIENASAVRNDFARYLDNVGQGARVVLTRLGRPAVAMISYEEFLDAFYPWKESES